MGVVLAKTAGFCFGVKRAVDIVYEKIQEGGRRIYTYGPIIHNEEVVKELEGKGVTVVEELSQLSALEPGVIIIRSHGVSRQEFEEMERAGFEVVDATCPFVKKIHRIVERESSAGKHVVIIGNASHPEVEGIMGWSQTPVTVIENEEEAQKFHILDTKSVYVVSQTTFNYKKFQELVEILEKMGYDISMENTICNATEERQTEARKLSKESDAMIVIGGRHSSNTQKLFEICKKECENTYYIQTLSDLDLQKLTSVRNVGITAGASTPNNIIQEVFKGMSEEFNMELIDSTIKTIRTGEVVEGTVISVKDDEIVLNIGYKSDGIITKNEYTNDASVDLTAKVSVGDKMNAKVLKVNDGEGQVLLTYKRLLAEKGNERLEEAFKNKEVLKAPVTQVVSGGLTVVYEETRVFIPASLVSDVYEKNLEKYQGQEIEFVISEFNPRRRRIIGDRKQLLVAEKKKKQEELFARINVGDTVEGTVKNVTDFGAFIDLGGADGLLHISEMSWGRVDNPKKLFKNGESIKVFIKDINGEKIALSLKFPESNPWLNAAEKYAVGNVVDGKVARMTDFGAFVELEPGVDALLHVSQIAREHVEKPADKLSIGQEIQAKIVDLNEQDKKISLSIKALLNEAPQEDVVEETVDAPDEADAVTTEDTTEE